MSKPRDMAWGIGLCVGSTAAALGAWWLRTLRPPAPAPNELRRSKSVRKDYQQGGTRQYSLPEKDGSDIAETYREVMIVAHRGASGRFPEHTQKGYHEAVRAGADVIEMDTCMTRDGHLVVRHDVLLDGDSNVDLVFDLSRKTNEEVTGSMDGDFTRAEGYFVHNFTLAEVKSLQCVQRMEGRKKFPNVDHKIMTLVEACTYLEQLRQHVLQKYNNQRDFGIYVETKRPSWHAALLERGEIQSSKSMEEAYVDDIIASGFGGRVYVQSFEPESLKAIKRLQDERLPGAEWVYIRLLTSDFHGRERGYPQERIDQLLPLPWKLEKITEKDTGETHEVYTNEYTKEGVDKLDEFFQEVAEYASGIGPWKNDILPNPAAPLDRSPVIDMAHKHGLAVHPYTFRTDVSRLPEMYMGNALEEYARFFELGVDGVFTDFASHARHARHVLTALGKEYHEIQRKTAFHSLDQVHPELLVQQRVAHHDAEQR